jgi:uncharacterized protein (TIGR01244 family)
MNDIFRTLTPTLFASPQITLADVADAKARGVTLIINNRPEDESANQTPGDEIEAAARAAGIDYITIPVTHAGFSQWQVDAMAKALDSADGKVLAYCRSGTRSTLLWALARSSQGEHPAVLAEKAADAGYDLTPIAAMMDVLRGRAS